MAELKEQEVCGKFCPYAVKILRESMKCLNELSVAMVWEEQRMLNDLL